MIIHDDLIYVLLRVEPMRTACKYLWRFCRRLKTSADVLSIDDDGAYRLS